MQNTNANNIDWQALEEAEQEEIDEIVFKLDAASAALGDASDALKALSETDFEAATASNEAFNIIANALRKLGEDYDLDALVAQANDN